MPVVMVSARAYDQDRIDAHNAGVQHYVVKPFDAEELVAAVDGAVALDAPGTDRAAGAGTGAEAGAVDARSAEEQVADLEEQLERLRDLDRGRSEFLGRVSHDLRTPLTAVKGFGQWLQLNWDRTADDRKRELVDRVVDAGMRLEELVSGLADFSRLERRKLEVTLAPHRLAPLVEETLHHLAPVLEHHELDVRLEDDTTVLVDRAAMLRVIENLLTNAATFSPPGSTVHVSTGSAAGSGVPAQTSGVMLSVRDEGIGIAAAEQARVFDLFYRVPGAAARQGTGLGLTLVKQYVEAQEGSVELASAPGEGSDFRLHLRTVPAQR